VSAYDVVVIGGGIAGVSVAYELTRDRDVALLEMEEGLAFHTTGRSAAVFLESYGGPLIRLLTTSSRAFLEDPPDGFDPPLMTPLPLLWIAAEPSADALRAMEAEVRRSVPSVRLVCADEAVEICPILRPEFLALGMLEPESRDLDVHALHQGYVRGLRKGGGEVFTSAGVCAMERTDTIWTITDRAGRTYRAPVVVNAAGAWCDVVAALAGARPIGIRPMLRTLFTIAAPTHLGDLRHLPLTADVDSTFYLKPEGPQFLCSPADEVPSDPCDARPDELNIARALDSIREATILEGRHVSSSWAGLRSFVADRVPVAGYDDDIEGLFWLAGQGGYGIQTAPALARVAAALIRGQRLPDDVAAKGLSSADLHRSRLERVG
jgi:D-arginine dehydrogenase